MSKKKRNPTPRNPQATRRRILETARRAFSQWGYEGVSVNDVVQKAKVNKRMVYHYFGDKAGLYGAVLADHWLQVKERIDQGITHEAKGGDADPRILLVAVLEIYFDWIAENPDHVRLLTWEGLQGGHVSRKLWTGTRGPIFAQIEFILKIAAKQGLLRPGLEPTHLVVSFLGVITFYFTHATTLGDLLGGNPLSPPLLKQRRHQVKCLLDSVFVPTE